MEYCSFRLSRKWLKCSGTRVWVKLKLYFLFRSIDNDTWATWYANEFAFEQIEMNFNKYVAIKHSFNLEISF